MTLHIAIFDFLEFPIHDTCFIDILCKKVSQMYNRKNQLKNNQGRDFVSAFNYLRDDKIG